MDTELKETLARIERATAETVTGQVRAEQLLEGIAGRQKVDGDLQRMMAERQEEIIRLLTPEEKDGPSIDELLGHSIGQLTELTGYVRQIAKAQSKMEQDLPGDVARAVAEAKAPPPGANGKPAGVNGTGQGSRP